MHEKRPLTPLETDALRRCVERGSTRTNDGGIVDDLLSGLCSCPGTNNGYLVRWEMNPDFRTDGYANRYVPTDEGRRLIEEAGQ